LKHSLDAFNANHDALTGAPNRAAFDKTLAAAIEASLRKAGSDEFTATEVTAPSTLALLALDIDHFKQLNDTFGHLYGDIVLLVFVHRIERSLTGLEDIFGERLQTSFARLGGEEFGILVSGGLTSNDLKQVAEELRRAVADEPLPTDKEWAELEQAGAITSLSLPHVTDRRVTVSIGVAVLTPTPTPSSPTAASSHLRSNADAALFRAKSGGRNTVRQYSDILDRHGRVLQHHPATGLVAIDIGRTVGVAVGQEFTVFHPDFVGDKPFLYDDGRTQKRLGKYPRHPCARLLVIDAQQDISFCRAISSELLTSIPVGSALELVPVGSIAHLLAPDLKFDVIGAPVLTPPERLPSIVQEMAAAKAPLQAAVVSLLDVDTLAKERGTAFVNSALANLYRALREAFPIHKAIAQIHPTQFAIVLSDPNPSNLSGEFGEVLRVASEKSAGLANFRAGAYWPDYYSVPFKGDRSNLQAENSLEYARFAAAPQDPEPEQVCLFTPSIASRVLSAWRTRQRHREAIADYFRLRELGLQYAAIENLAALSALSIGDSEKSLALEAIGLAVELNPDNSLYKANQAYIECSFGDRAHAWELFSELPDTYTLTNVYLGRRALALVAAYAAHPGDFSVGMVRDIIREVLALDASLVSRAHRAELQAFLDTLAAPKTPPS
jgi:diguanylate cyclase (GGDEF)-like protein